MIAIGHTFSTGAVVLGVIPADRDSVIVLARVREGEYVTGRVYVRQLPHPDEWHNGNYFNVRASESNLEDAVDDWLHRTGAWSGNGLRSATKHMVALIRSTEERLSTIPKKKPKFTVYDYAAHARNCVARNVRGPGTICENPAAHGDYYVIEEGENR